MPELLHAFEALLADHVPADLIAVLVDRDVLRQRLQREMRRGEAEVFEERLVREFFRVLLEALDGVIGDEAWSSSSRCPVRTGGSFTSSSKWLCGLKKRLWSSSE